MSCNIVIHKRNGGFTLIELVLVIVISGILSATALPRFSNLSSDARQTVIKGVEGALASTSSLVFLKAKVDGVITGTVTIDGEDVALKGGYIEGHWNNAWRYALNVNKDISFTNYDIICTKNSLCGVGAKSSTVIASLPIVTSTSGVVIVWSEGMRIDDLCYAYYYNPNTNNPAPSIAPSIGSVLSGC